MATQADKTNTGLLATIVVVGSFMMITVSALVAALVRTERSRLDQARPSHADLETVAALEREQLANVTGPPRWIDRAKGKVAIPIDVAMQRIVAEYRQRPEAASPPPPPGLVMNPVPAAGTAPAVPGVAPAASSPTAPTAPADAPPATTPSSAAAPAATPPASTPPASTPPVATPPVATPPVATPPAATPPAATPPAATPPAPIPPPTAPAQSAPAPAVAPPSPAPAPSGSVSP